MLGEGGEQAESRSWGSGGQRPDFQGGRGGPRLCLSRGRGASASLTAGSHFPPPEASGTNIFNFAYLFWGGLAPRLLLS